MAYEIGTVQVYNDPFQVVGNYQAVTGTGVTFVDITVSSIPAGAVLICYGSTDGSNVAGSTCSMTGFTWTRRISNAYVDVWTTSNTGGDTSGTVRYSSGSTIRHMGAVIVITAADASNLTNYQTSSGWGPLTNWSTSDTLVGARSFYFAAVYTYSSSTASLAAGANTTLLDTLRNPSGAVLASVRSSTATTGLTTLAGTWDASVSGLDVSIEVRAA